MYIYIYTIYLEIIYLKIVCTYVYDDPVKLYFKL